MSLGSLLFLALIALVVIMLLSSINIYNRLVRLKNRFQNGFAQIEVQLKRRHDLIPNLVEVAKGYMRHERETLEEVINARNMAKSGLERASKQPGDPLTMERLAGAEGVLTGALGRLFALVESYPDLKANQNMMQLTEELTTTENRVSFARQAYNDSAMEFNSYRESFPPILLANLFGFHEKAGLLEFESEEIAKPVKVEFK